jgi:hypothetical protein
MLETFSILKYICQKEILAEKIILGVLEGLENSKNTRKIDGKNFPMR